MANLPNSAVLSLKFRYGKRTTNLLMARLIGNGFVHLVLRGLGLDQPFAPQFRKLFELTPTQVAVLVATPVILGSLARIPIGMLTDRLGGRLVFSGLMVVCATPAFLVAMAGSFHQLLVIGFFLGLAGSSLAVGVGYVSRWTRQPRQARV